MSRERRGAALWAITAAALWWAAQWLSTPDILTGNFASVSTQIPVPSTDAR